MGLRHRGHPWRIGLNASQEFGPRGRQGQITALERARVLVPALPGIKRLQKIIYTQMQRAMLAQVSPDQALTAAASEWNRYARSRWPEAAGNP